MTHWLEDWEYDYSIPPQIPPPSLIPGNLPPVPCLHCHKIATKPHYVVKHFGRHTEQMAFCDELCHELYYMNRLRERGLI